MLGWLFWGAGDGFTRVEEGENVAKVDWLPEEANQVSFHKSYGFTAYEFNISEKGFLDLARREGWEIKPIGAETVSVERYLSHRLMTALKGKSVGDSDQEQEEHQKKYEEWKRDSRHIIAKGYYYKWLRGQTGGGIWVGYDSENGRAYYHTQPR